MVTPAPFSAMPRFCPSEGIAVDVEAIQFDRVRHVCRLVLRRGSVADLNDVAVALVVGLELEEQQAPVVCAGRRAQRRGCVTGADLREQGRVRRCHARAGRRLPVAVRRADRDDGGSTLDWQDVVADVGRASLEQDRVAGLRRVDGGLQVAAGVHREGIGVRPPRSQEHERAKHGQTGEPKGPGVVHSRAEPGNGRTRIRAYGNVSKQPINRAPTDLPHSGALRFCRRVTIPV